MLNVILRSAIILLLCSCDSKGNGKIPVIDSVTIATDKHKQIVPNLNLITAKYHNQRCISDSVSDEEYLAEFQGFKEMGDLNNDGKLDSMFILPPLNRCEEGQSYYFTDPKIERIYTESGCCQLLSLINIGDINGDGLAEVAEYYSSCASRYKAITIWSLGKDFKWTALKSFSYVLNDKFDIEKDLKKLFRKTSKNQFEYFEIEDVDINGKLVAAWRKLSMR